MIPSELQPIANHLWQSTVFAALAALLALALRKNRAQVRYRLWLAASVKFLIPFSILMAAGSHFGRQAVAVSAPPQWSSVVEEVSEPFATSAPPVSMPAIPQSHIDPIPLMLCALW